MPAEFFLDTNVFIYTFDRSHPAKRARSRELVERALETGDGVVSYQVAQEFLNVALHKFARPLAPHEAVRYLRDVLDPLCMVFSSLPLYEHAISLQRRWRLGFYDSLIVAGALEAGCKTLYSEDLQDGQEIESVRIVNPF
jgi:predicted nucleic acid-binding protein